MNSDLFGLIIAGGSGTRLWPISRTSNPKQLLDLSGSGHSLLQECFTRMSRTVAPGNIKTVTGAGQDAQVLAQLRELSSNYPPENVMCEPFGRDSAPAVLWGALQIASQQPDALAVVTWSDGLIRQEDTFDSALRKAATIARQGHLVIVGVHPHWPSTMLGYMKCGAAVEEGVYEVERFVEKPDSGTARKFLSEGGYAWNPGIFVFNIKTLLSEFERHAPDMMAVFRECQARLGQGGWTDPALIQEIYGRIQKSPLTFWCWKSPAICG